MTNLMIPTAEETRTKAASHKIIRMIDAAVAEGRYDITIPQTFCTADVINELQLKGYEVQDHGGTFMVFWSQ